MTTTGLLDRAVAAAGERAGRDLLQWRTATDLTHLAASKVKGSLATTGAAGGTLLTDVPLLKAGTFHGGAVTLDASDLVAMVERFGVLAPDVFVPPVRIDHSWNVLNVIGHIADLRVTQRADPSNAGKLTAYLDGDLQILDDTALGLIQRGILRNRSSEVGPYEANTGDLHSLVMWGVAFVDIPAVEGLGPVPLSKMGRAISGLGAPHLITMLTESTEETPVSEPTTAPAAGEPTEDEQPSAVPDSEGTPDGDQPSQGEQPQPQQGTPPVGEGDGDQDEDDDEDQDQGGDAHEQQDAPPAAEAAPAPVDQSPAPEALAARRAALGLSADATPAQVLRALGLTRQADDLESRERADLARQVGAYAAKGLLGKTARPAAEALLGHHDSSVREHARTLLDNLPAPVKAGNGEHLGKTTSTATGPRGDDAPGAADLTASEDLQELGRQFFALTPAQRKPGTPEALAYDARRLELEAASR